jgi:triosephosphate isomerase
MRKQIVAGNWKMNKGFYEGLELANALISGLSGIGSLRCEVVLGVSFPYLIPIRDLVSHTPGIAVAAQNAASFTEGAYTGEVSAGQLASCGIPYVILGHSERRMLFGETDSMLKTKVDLALAAGLQPIFCCGEPREVRESDQHEALIEEQVKSALFHLSANDLKRIVIAYEPVWAIGTGLTASSQQAQDMHAFIRGLLTSQYGASLASDISILYGGSVKSTNASELFAMPDVDGGLVGGASLQADEFLKIVACAN